MCTASIHGKELALHVEEADVGAAAERGVQEAAALRGERRGCAEEPPRRAPLFLCPAARRHGGRSWCFCSALPASTELPFFRRGT